MAYFLVRYKVGKKRGFEIVEAENRVEAINAFMEHPKGVIVSIEETAPPLSLRLVKLKERYLNPIKNRPVNLERFVSLLDQMGVMLDAGLPINFVLAEVVKNEKDPMLKAIFGEILRDIESGKGFYEAAKRFERQLGNLALSMIRLGEETGSLAEQIVHLSSILQEILDNRKKFKKATRYPIFIMVAMSIAFVVVMLMVVPQFEAFFKESKMELPLPTKFLLWVEHALLEYGLLIGGGAVGIAFLIGYLYKKNDRIHLLLDRLILKIIIVGKATFYAMISRFMYIFRVLQEAGIPMIEALEIAMGIVENRFLKDRLQRIAYAIEEGRSLAQGFRDTELFENMVIEMVRSGEIGGGLGKMLGKVTKIYKDRFDYIVDNIATLIEPILIAAIAGFVLTLALGIFLPMWNMVNIAG